MDFCQGVFEGFGGLEESHFFFRPEINFDLIDDTATSDDGRHAEADVANAVGALDEGGNGEDAFLIKSDGVNNIADGHADGPAGSAFALNDFGAAATGPFK